MFIIYVFNICLYLNICFCYYTQSFRTKIFKNMAETYSKIFFFAPSEALNTITVKTKRLK